MLPPGEKLGGGLVNTYIRKEGTAKAYPSQKINVKRPQIMRY